MFWKYPLTVQSYNSGPTEWTTYTFETKKDHIDYIQNQFKIPGKYNLSYTEYWKETGNIYTKSQKATGKPNFEGGKYHSFSDGSARHNQWKEKEKDKIKNGLIVNGWYIPPFYYWYLNFCPIYDDLAKEKRFGDVWDSDYWYMQYCMLAILHGHHIGGVKGRQKGYSYKHMAILYWSYCWFDSSVNTIGAYDEKLVKKSWRFLEGYRAHINTTTTWRRGPTIAKSLEWNEFQMDENNVPQGNMAILKGVTFKQTTDNDVGGSTTFFNYEEPGVSPTILETLEFVRPSVEKGSETTGIIIACGSVGNLDDAEGIKSIFYNPEDYNFHPVTNVWDENENKGKPCCIFISEAYNMIGFDDITGKPFFDKDGNSDVELALDWIKRKKEAYKSSTKKAELKQLQTSQKCTSPEEAFKERKTSEFPIAQLRKQQERILLKEKEDKWDKKPRKGLFEESDLGAIILNTHNPPQEHRWPINPEWEDKRGVWTIYEEADENPEMFVYFACVDAIEVDVTETSTSIASVDIFKTAIQVTYKDAKGKIQTRIEGDKLVATYRGRFDTARKTNEQIWLGIKKYNAFTYPERNKPNFINFMREMGRAERYLAKESDVPLFKDLNIKNGNVANNSKFGFHKGDNTEIWKHFKSAAKEYFFTEYGRNTFEKDGVEETLKIFTGIDRIDDYWLLEEFCNYIEVNGKAKGNFDRLISFMGALFICKIYQQNRFTKKRSEIVEEEVQEQYRSREINMLGGSYRQTQARAQKPRSMI